MTVPSRDAQGWSFQRCPTYKVYVTKLICKCSMTVRDCRRGANFKNEHITPNA